MARLGDICEILDSMRVPITASDRKPGPYPYYGANGVQDYVADYIFDDELVLLAEDGGNFGSKDKPIAYRVSGKCWVNNHAHVLKPKEGVDVDYLCYSLMFYDVTGLVNGATRKKLTQADMRKIEILLPPLDEQRKIAAVLDKISDLTAKRRRQLDKLDELEKSRFVEMFGDLRKNPKGWPIKTFDEFAKIDGNITTDYAKYANYPHIGIDSIEKITGELKGYRTVREDGVISGKYVFTPKHIIYSKIRPNLNKVALPDFDGLCSADAYPILPNEKNCERIFLALAMRSQYFLDYILQFSSRTNLPKVNRKEIAGFRLPLPPLELQKQFSAFFYKSDKIKAAIRKNLEKLEMLKKALMQEYFIIG